VLNLLHPDANIDTNGYHYRDCDSYGDCNSYCHCNSYCYCYSYGYCYRDHDTAAYSVTKGYCAAKASADSRAAVS